MGMNGTAHNDEDEAEDTGPRTTGDKILEAVKRIERVQNTLSNDLSQVRHELSQIRERFDASDEESVGSTPHTYKDRNGNTIKGEHQLTGIHVLRDAGGKMPMAKLESELIAAFMVKNRQKRAHAITNAQRVIGSLVMGGVFQGDGADISLVNHR